MSSTESIIAPKATRASKPKVTTGCITCKARHVKCDEKKPNCWRCQSTGRSCDGYHLARRTHARVTLPVSFALATIPGSGEERRCFYFFHSRTVVQLCGLFGSEFWSRYVLQAGLRERAIWHALVALGSLHRQFEPGCYAKMGQNREAGSFTLRQYVLAIGYLLRPNNGRERQPMDVTLMSCILFTCFESLRGHYASALVHLDNGVKLLLELQQSEDCDQSTEIRDGQVYPSIPYTSLQSVRTILTCLDTQASQILARRKTRLRPPPEIANRATLHNPLRPFTSLAEARHESDQLWNYCLYALQHSPTEPSPLSLLKPDAAQLYDCSRRLDQWSTAFETFLHHSQHKFSAQEQQAANVMRIYKIMASMSLSPDYRADIDDELVWDAHDLDFANILFLANSVIDSAIDTSLAADAARFSLDTCVVGPLYFVASRCRHKILRRKAISLLRLSPRLEGLWDGYLFALVAERVLDIEESVGIGDGGVGGSDGRRVSDVDVGFDLEGRRATVRYLQKIGGTAIDGELRQDLIEW